jgi:TRAP-type C4-dicarboxylate transport system substrate-binding protein
MKRSPVQRLIHAVTTVSLLAIAAFNPAAAEEELIFNVFIPRPAPLYKNALEPWAREVEAASNGALKITIPTSTLAPPAKQYDIVQDGVADISVAPLAFKRKKLGLDTIAGIPLISPTAKGASMAAWDTHEKFFADAGQWKDFVPLTLFTLGAPAILSNAQPLLSKDDLDGFKVLAVGKDKIGTWKNLGATPVGGSGQKPFEVVSSGVADGATNPLGTAVIQGLLDATKNVTLVPGGMGGRAVFAIFISRDRFDGLPADAQNALTSTAGLALAGKIGGIMDKIDGSGLKKFQDKGIAIHEAPADFIADINAAGEFITENWKAGAAKAGVDAEAALTHFKSIAGGQ